MSENKYKITAGTVARTVILAIALINQLLTAAGKSALPIEDETVTQFVSCAFTIGAAVVGFWKNNSFTKAAIMADTDLKVYKENEK